MGEETAADSKGLAKHVVLKLLQTYYRLGYNILVDDYYSSVLHNRSSWVAMTPGNELHDASLTIKMRTVNVCGRRLWSDILWPAKYLFRAQKWSLAEWLNTLPQRAQRTQNIFSPPGGLCS